MAVGADRITFWFGCNMLRHAEMIRLSIMLLERVGYDVSAAGGPAYCCGTAHDHQPHGASNMAARTVARFNEAADKEGRGTVVTWCPSCHMHMSDIMAPGNAAAFEIAHITELLADRADRLAPLLHGRGEAARAAASACGVCHACAGQRSRRWTACAHSGLGAGRGTGASRAHVQRACRGARSAGQGRAARRGRPPSPAGCDTVCTIFHSCHRELAALDGKDGVRVRNWVQLVAEAMGIEASDAYLGWRKGGAPDIAAIERADEVEVPGPRRAGTAKAAPGLASFSARDGCRRYALGCARPAASPSSTPRRKAPMQKRKLGKSGLEIAPLVFGGNVFGWTADEATSFKLLDAFVDAGFNCHRHRRRLFASGCRATRAASPRPSSASG